MSYNTDSRAVRIPQTLKNIARWTTWEQKLNPHGRMTKVPRGSTLDPDNRLPWRDVSDIAPTPMGGLGFVMTGGVDTDTGRLLAFDLDGCRSPSTGVPTQWALEIIEAFGRSYTEVTPSGTGFRLWIIVRNAPPPIPKIDIPIAAPDGVDKNPEIQVFGCGPAGYVTVSGEHLAFTDLEPKVVASVKWLLDRYKVKPVDVDQLAAELPAGRGDAPAVEDIAARLEAAPNGKEMVGGDWAALELPSASELWFRLVRATLRASRHHGRVAVEFLLERTAFGRGLVDSRDPDRYARPDWVVSDVSRIAGKTHETGADPFADGFDVDAWALPEPPPDRSGEWLLQAGEFDAQVQEQRFLVYGVLPARGLAQFFGDPSCGKTPFAISLALHVALGESTWFGHDVERPGSVVYMIGEDPTGVRDRVKAQLHQMGREGDLAGMPLYLTTRPGRLIEPKNARQWADRILAKLAGGTVSLLVVDTQNRNFGPGNENDTQDMTAFVESIDALGRALGCLVLLVHHTGHQNKTRARGASVLPAAIDASFEIVKTGMAVTAKPYKSKNWREPTPIAGLLDPVAIGNDSKGRPITAITLVDSSASVFDDTDEAADKVVAFLVETGETPVGFAAIGTAAETSKNRIGEIIDDLVASGRVEIVADGNRREGKSYRVVQRKQRTYASLGIL